MLNEEPVTPPYNRTNRINLDNEDEEVELADKDIDYDEIKTPSE